MARMKGMSKDGKVKGSTRERKGPRECGRAINEGLKGGEGDKRTLSSKEQKWNNCKGGDGDGPVWVRVWML